MSDDAISTVEWQRINKYGMLLRQLRALESERLKVENAILAVQIDIGKYIKETLGAANFEGLDESGRIPTEPLFPTESVPAQQHFASNKAISVSQMLRDAIASFNGDTFTALDLVSRAALIYPHMGSRLLRNESALAQAYQQIKASNYCLISMSSPHRYQRRI